MGQSKYNLLSINSYLISLLLLIQSLFYYLVTDHILYHVGHSLVFVVIVLFFFTGYFFRISSSGEFLNLVFYPVLFASLVLKVLWTGGVYSPFLLWIFLLTFSYLFIDKKKFSRALILISFLLSNFSLLYFVKLNQMNFAHGLFKLTTLNYLLIYTVPFFYLFIFIYKLYSFEKRQDSFNRLDLSKDSLETILKSYIENEVNLFFVADKRLKVKVYTKKLDHQFEDIMVLFGYKLENYTQNEKSIDFIFFKVD